GYAGLSAPFDSTDTCSFIWRLHAANAASDAVVFNVCFVPEAEVDLVCWEPFLLSVVVNS
ncbi:hypothetical protein, partial [Klebsiella variicola]|uniref:hypothetical protein n=1 Tax=Klebsiella variicola TaxID=244366 RepID=UPI001C2CE2D4